MYLVCGTRTAIGGRFVSIDKARQSVKATDKLTNLPHFRFEQLPNDFHSFANANHTTLHLANSNNNWCLSIGYHASG